MPDEELDILIRTQADTTGFDQTTQAQQKLTEGGKENEQQTFKLGNAHRDLHKAMHMVTEQSPLLGSAVRAALNPIGAAIGGALIIFKQVNDHIKEMNSLFDKLESAAAGPIGNMKESMREAKEQIAQHNQEFSNWLSNLKESSGQVTEQLQKEVEKINEQTEAIRKLALARVDAMQLAGTISDADAERRKAAIGGALDKEVSAKTIEAMQQAASTLSGLVADAQVKMFGDQSRETDKTRANVIKDLPKRIEDMTASVDKLNDVIKEQTKQRDEVDKKLEEETENRKAMGTPLRGGRFDTLTQELAEANKQLDDSTRLRNMEKLSIEHAHEKLTQLNLDQTNATNQAERSKTAFKGLSEELKKTVDELERARGKAALQGSAADAGALGGLKGLQGTGIGAAAFQDVQQAEAIAKLLQDRRTAGQVTPEQIQQLIDTASAIAGRKVNMAEALGMMNWAMKDVQNFATDVGRLTDAMIKFAQDWQKAGWADLGRRLNYCEQQIRALKPTLPGG